MSGWIQDLVRALRLFRRTPWFVAGLIFVLALGTGANAAIFSLVQAVLLRPLPYDRPDELVMVWSARNTPADWREYTHHRVGPCLA